MKTTIIGIAGGTGSGKSTFTNRLKDYFGDKVTVIYHDNYYAPHDDLTFKERQTINYDHPNALETDLLVKHLKELRNGIASNVPSTISRSIPAPRKPSSLNPATSSLSKAS